MKIEIGESVMYTWLRHVKGCCLAQTNWKSSPKWEYDAEELGTMKCLADEIQKHFADRGWNIFKNDQTLEQALKQVESDVMGVKWQDDVPVYYAVESAFHENGLNYGSKEVTCSKVISKLVRTAIAMHLYMPNSHCDILFASPKVNKNIMEQLPMALEELNAIFQNNSMDCFVGLVANEVFQEEILNPVLDLLNENIADTSELFVRSMQLVNMFSTPQRVSITTQTKRSPELGKASEDSDVPSVKPRYNARQRNDIVCSTVSTNAYPSVCWMNISKTRLNNEELNNYYFYCMIENAEYFYSIPIGALRSWLENNCTLIKKGTPRYSFYINYRKGTLTPDAAENGDVLTLIKSDWI